MRPCVGSILRSARKPSHDARLIHSNAGIGSVLVNVTIPTLNRLLSLAQDPAGSTTYLASASRGDQVCWMQTAVARSIEGATPCSYRFLPCNSFSYTRKQVTWNTCLTCYEDTYLRRAGPSGCMWRARATKSDVLSCHAKGVWLVRACETEQTT